MPNYFELTIDFLQELMRGSCPARDFSSPSRVPADGETRPILIAGHRGSPLFEPENTLPGFKRAIEDGANAIELDLCITKDEQIIAWHDWTPDGTVARVRWLEVEPQNNYRPTRPDEEWQGPVAEFDLETFRKHYGYALKDGNEPVDVPIPTLEEVVEWAKDEHRLKALFLDCNIPDGESDLGPAFMREMDRILEPVKDRLELILEVQGPGMVDHALASTTADRVSLDMSVPPGLVLDIAEYSSATPAVQKNLGASLVLRPRLTTLFPWTTYRRIMKRELAIASEASEVPNTVAPLVFAATINREEELRCLLKMGVTAFQTDLPHVMGRVVEQG